MLPYYWAAPILAGKANAIEFKKQFPWKWIVAIFAVTVVSFWFWRKKRRGKILLFKADDSTIKAPRRNIFLRK